MAVRGSGAFGRRIVRAAAPSKATRPGEWTPRGTVLVTGGTGALGGHVARWLAHEGAGHLVLTSRSGPDAPGASELRTELEELGVRVTVAACDAADREALARLLDEIGNGGGDGAPLTAVFHAAGVLDDGVLDAMTPERLATVFRAKAESARNLDELTAGLDLSAFVLFSSFAGVAGGAGQGSYAAANAFLDGLARARRARGLTATSVAWGPWAGSGMAAEGVAAERLRGGAIPPLEPDRAIAALKRLLTQDCTAVMVADVDWQQYAPAFTAVRPSRLYTELPEVERLRPPRSPTAAPADRPPGRVPTWWRSSCRCNAPSRNGCCSTSSASRSPPYSATAARRPSNPARAFRELGFDSLTAVELRNLRQRPHRPRPARHRGLRPPDTHGARRLPAHRTRPGHLRPGHATPRRPQPARRQPRGGRRGRRDHPHQGGRTPTSRPRPLEERRGGDSRAAGPKPLATQATSERATRGRQRRRDARIHQEATRPRLRPTMQPMPWSQLRVANAM